MVGLGLISFIPTSFQLPLVYIPMSFHSELYCVTYPLVIFPLVSNELPSGTLTYYEKFQMYGWFTYFISYKT